MAASDGRDGPRDSTLYPARIKDLGPRDFVKVDCEACHHTALLSLAFLSRLGLDPRCKVLDLRDPSEPVRPWLPSLRDWRTLRESGVEWAAGRVDDWLARKAGKQ